MNFARNYHGCCSHAGHLFVCGGKDGEPSTCCEKFIIKEDKWIFIAEMNEARKYFQVVTCGKHVRVIGGEGINGALNTTEYYDHITDKWIKSSSMIERRCEHSVVAFCENIYVFGGVDIGCLSTTKKLDIKTMDFNKFYEYTTT